MSSSCARLSRFSISAIPKARRAVPVVLSLGVALAVAATTMAATMPATMPDVSMDRSNPTVLQPGVDADPGVIWSHGVIGDIRDPSAAGAITAVSGLPFSSPAYGTASQPRTITSDDLNGDTYPDMILPCNGTNVTQVFYGTSSGIYRNAPDATIVGDNNAQHAAVADFNGDGRKDLAIVYYFGGVRVFTQDAGGAFVPWATLALDGQYSRCLVACDLDGDPWPDLAIVSERAFASPYYGRVTLWNGGPSGFSYGGSFTTNAYIADWIVAADMNEDGRTDLVVTNDAPSSRVAILLNTGSSAARLSAPALYDVGPGPNTCAVADLNADGHEDVAVASWFTSPGTGPLASETILLGRGDGTLNTAMVTYPPRLQEGDPFAIAVGELTGDAYVDLAIACGVMGTVSVLPGNGDGTFGTGRLYGVGTAARGIALTDVNGDGRTDIAVSNVGSSTFQVLTARASGDFPGAVYAIGNDTPATFDLNSRLIGTLAAGDVDNDGHLDVATVHAATSTVSIVRGAGDGTFGPPSDINVGSNPQAVLFADLDGDGNLDLATANAGSGTVSALFGMGDGTFKGKSGYGVGKAPFHLAAADLDGDGRTDLVTADHDDNTVSVLLKTGNGAGFKGRMKFDAGIGPRWVATGDLNLDGIVDLVVADEFSAGFSVLYGTGDGSLFGPPVFTSTGGAPLSVTAADLDLDGIPEIVVSNTGISQVEVWKSTSSGGYSLDRYYLTQFYPREVTVGDLDGDGYPEIVAAVTYGHAFVLYYRSPAPANGYLRWGFGSHCIAVVAADANEDGWPDLLALDWRCQGLTVLLNEYVGTPLLAVRRSTPASIAGARNVSLDPNPLNPTGTLRFEVTKAGPLRISLFDVRGRLVNTVLDELLAAAGKRSVAIDGRDRNGHSMASGVYFYRIESAGGTVTGRFAVLK